MSKNRPNHHPPIHAPGETPAGATPATPATPSSEATAAPPSPSASSAPPRRQQLAREVRDTMTLLRKLVGYSHELSSFNPARGRPRLLHLQDGLEHAIQGLGHIQNLLLAEGLIDSAE